MRGVSLRRPSGFRYDRQVRSPLKTALLGMALAWSATVVAQDQSSQNGDQAGDQAGSSQYAGVSPGSGHAPPRAPEPGGSGPVLMTWPGFQARPDGASRFFLQTTGPVQVEQKHEDGRFVVVLKGCRLHLRNNRRPLETRYFNTPVSSARIERRGRDLAFVMSLRADVTPVVSTQSGANGYNFVLLEFPAGNYLPDELRTERDQPQNMRLREQGSGAQPAGESGQAPQGSDPDSVEIMVY